MPLFDNLSPVDYANPVNRHHPLNQGRLAWWLCLPATMGGRQFFDLMGLYNGTLTAMTFPSHTTSWNWGSARPGGWGHLDMNTSSGSPYVDITNTATGPLALTTDWTLACWFYPTQLSGSQSLISRYLTGGDNAYDLGTSGTALATFASGSVSGGTLANNTAWYHGVASTIANATTLYLNGVSVGTGSLSTSAGSSGVHLGNGFTASRQFAGFLDDASIWNRGLSASEVLSLYHESRSGYPATLNRLPVSAEFLASAASAVLFRRTLGMRAGSRGAIA